MHRRPRAGVAEGLDPETAVQLAVGTMYGTAKLLMEGGLSTEELVTAVSSPGGTTVAALEAMEEAGFSDALAKGVQAAGGVRRSCKMTFSLIRALTTIVNFTVFSLLLSMSCSWFPMGAGS